MAGSYSFSPSARRYWPFTTDKERAYWSRMTVFVAKGGLFTPLAHVQQTDQFCARSCSCALASCTCPDPMLLLTCPFLVANVYASLVGRWPLSLSPTTWWGTWLLAL
eukprot:jgi/Botrbrau1/16305/Bobra.0066s0073.1